MKQKDTAKKEAPSKAKKRPDYKLDDLIKQCDLTAPRSKEAAAWEAMPPVGKERLP